MEQAALVDAIGKHLDALATILNWVVGLAIVTIWTGAQRDEEVSLFGLKMTRKNAFYLLGAAFLYVNVISIVLFLRIGNILDAIDPKNFAKAMTVLGANAWPFNPFAYFGSSDTSLIIGNFGFGALIVIWWIAYTALAMCRDDRKSLDYWAVVGAFLIIGLLSIGAISYVFSIIRNRAYQLDPTWASSIHSQVIPRSILALAGIAVGVLIFSIASRVQARRFERSKAVQGSVSTGNP
jgi:hypothetical protein